MIPGFLTNTPLISTSQSSSRTSMLMRNFFIYINIKCIYIYIYISIYTSTNSLIQALESLKKYYFNFQINKLISKEVRQFVQGHEIIARDTEFGNHSLTIMICCLTTKTHFFVPRDYFMPSKRHIKAWSYVDA